MDTDIGIIDEVAYNPEYEIYAPEEVGGDITYRFHEDNQWKILVVDDEEDVHAITRLSLNDFKYKNRKLNLINVYSAEEARQYLNNHSDIAIVLLDVVMETTNAGLELVKFIREELKNEFVRIILRNRTTWFRT